MPKLNDLIELVSAHIQKYDKNWRQRVVSGCIIVEGSSHRGANKLFHHDIRFLSELLSVKCGVSVEFLVPDMVIRIVP